MIIYRQKWCHLFCQLLPVYFTDLCILCILQTRKVKITKLSNFGSTEGINLKLIPVTGLNSRRWLMISSIFWRHHACKLQTRTYFSIFGSLKYTCDDVTMLMTSQYWWRHQSSSIIKTCHWYKFQLDTFSRTRVIKLCNFWNSGL